MEGGKSIKLIALVLARGWKGPDEEADFQKTNDSAMVTFDLRPLPRWISNAMSRVVIGRSANAICSAVSRMAMERGAR